MMSDVYWERRIYKGNFPINSHAMYTHLSWMKDIGYSLTVVVFTYEVLAKLVKFVIYLVGAVLVLFFKLEDVGKQPFTLLLPMGLAECSVFVSAFGLG